MPKVSKVRRQGRPVAAESGVGKQTLITAALELLREMPPSMITIASIARAANVDPALVRYYFGNRENLILEVVDRLSQQEPALAPEDADGAAAIRARVRKAFRFTRLAKYMQRLMIDELAASEAPVLRERARVGNRLVVDIYRDIQKRDGGDALTKFDPVLLHIAICGLADFFMSAKPMIQLLEPDANMAKLEKRYEAFVTNLVLNGLLKR